MESVRTLPVPTSSGVHVVQAGETLTAIVRNYLKAGGGKPSNATVYEAVRRVAAGNGLSNPDRIYPGQRLHLGGIASGQARAQALALAGPVQVSAPAGAVAGLPLRSDARLLRPASNAAPRDSARLRMPVAAGGQGGPVRPAFRAARMGSMLGEAGAVRGVTRDLSELTDRLLDPAAVGERGGACEAPWACTLPGGRLTSGYGLRKDPVLGLAETHEGIDLAAKHGTPIHAYAEGVVSFSGWQAGYGRLVVVRHADGTESAYAHNSRNLVRAGDRVSKGMPVAEVGSSGRSTGPHLHFEIRKGGRAVDPMPYLAAAGGTGALQLAQRR
jgi:murein DD-endopeptidase MepM/ murein hydrolase activator NlpD